MNPEFWRKRKVLLTGHTGFKGGWLALWLASKGAVVRGYALDPATARKIQNALDPNRQRSHLARKIG